MPDSAALHIVTAVSRMIDAAVAAGEPAPSLAALATEVHLSPSHLRRIFEQTTGVTPRAYADARRADRLRGSLHAASSVTSAIHGSGFGSTSRVYERTGPLLGMSPAAYRRGAPGESIRFTVAESSLGPLVVASTETGVCLIAFGEPGTDFAAEVARRFPNASIEPASDEDREWVRAVVGLVDAPATTAAAELPLDIRGTAFQQQVWSALLRIPPGSTVTYAQLASAIGRPTATRAVAQACGANPLAVVVPCHRVVGSDGSLTGYRWGIKRKRTLLDAEKRG